MTPGLRLHRNLPHPVDRFQVMGERCSGTNFAAALIRANLPELYETRELGWKHGFFDRRLAASPGLLTVVIYRHPIRWLQSVHATPWQVSRTMRSLGFGAFIRATWEPVWSVTAADGTVTEYPIQGDMVPHTTVRFANALRLRAAKIGYYEELASLPGQVAFLRYEALNRDPGTMMAALAQGLGLAPLRRLVSIQGYKAGKRQRYAPRRFAPVAATDRAFIDQTLDRDVEARIGYDPWTVPTHDGLRWTDAAVLFAKKAAAR